MAVSGVGLLPVGMLVHAVRAPTLTKVVGEDAVAAPGSGAIDAGEFGAVPAVAAFEVIDSAFGSGPPFDLVAEGSPVFKFAAGGAGFTPARDRRTAHAECVQIAFNRYLAVAAVGGDRAGCVSGAAGDPFDRQGQLRSVCGVPDLDGVVEDDSVGIVDDLCFVAELDGLAQPPFTDRASSASLPCLSCSSAVPIRYTFRATPSLSR
jgi:hypothetical protein